VGERIVGVYNLSPIAESYTLVGRKPGEPPFTEDEVERLRELIISFPRVHHWLALERGLIAPAKKPFAPRERDIVRALLGPETEQEIADRLELSRGTVHNYVGDIYRKLGVEGRNEMLALWLEGIEVRE
ncbi:MAG: LuxR C-terminal-related transcriptional regulator, partial [Myxococcota bacterium]